MNATAPRFNNAPMVKVEGPCDVCPKHVEKWVPKSVAKKMKNLICNTYNCKRLLAAKLAREKAERTAKKAEENKK